jgi:hypothetical protein
LISATVVGFDTKLWPAGTIFSDSARSKCELRYATIPSELSASSSIPRFPMML